MPVVDACSLAVSVDGAAQVLPLDDAAPATPAVEMTSPPAATDAAAKTATRRRHINEFLRINSPSCVAVFQSVESVSANRSPIRHHPPVTN
jgi:hypothetical protein